MLLFKHFTKKDVSFGFLIKIDFEDINLKLENMILNTLIR